MERYLISCPPAGLDLAEKKALLLKQILAWIHSEPLCKLVFAWGRAIPKGVEEEEYIRWMDEFVNVWDIRLRQAGGGERFKLHEDEMTIKHSDLIYSAAQALGLAEGTRILDNVPDYILPLGGARLANYSRCQFAKRMLECFPGADPKPKIVALSGKRLLEQIEYPYVSKYCTGAKTEYDAINGALETLFFEQNHPFTEENSSHTDDLNMQWAVRSYGDYNGAEVFSLAAPSSAPLLRRANSEDTFVFFLKHFSPKKGSSIILVTSSIYVPFQLLKFIPYSFEHDISVDCVGSSAAAAASDNEFGSGVHYLQEIKATVNGISSLMKRGLLF